MPRAKRQLNRKTRKLAQDMWESGSAIVAIAEECDVHRETVKQYLRKLGLYDHEKAIKRGKEWRSQMYQVKETPCPKLIRQWGVSPELVEYHKVLRRARYSHPRRA